MNHKVKQFALEQWCPNPKPGHATPEATQPPLSHVCRASHMTARPATCLGLPTALFRVTYENLESSIYLAATAGSDRTSVSGYCLALGSA